MVNPSSLSLQKSHDGGKAMIETTVLGSGTGVPSLKRAAPGLLLKSARSTILIDSGSGTLRRMLEAGVTYQDVDFLLYTHTHPDHVADLVPILFACKYAENPREADLFCLGGPGFSDYFKKLETAYGSWIKPESYRLTIREVPSHFRTCRDVKISAKCMSHLPGSVGYRIQDPDRKSVVISGDTDYCQNIVDLAYEADLLVLECSFPDGKKVEGHLTPSLAGRIAKESGCRKLLLTPFYPQCDQEDILSQCRHAFDGDVVLAEDFMKIKIEDFPSSHPGRH
jgi:ribonuclease BN (tRNA processing enzyme)